MYEGSIIGKAVIGLLGIIVVILGVWSYSMHQEQQVQEQLLQETIKNYEEKEQNTEEEVANLKKQLDTLYIEKNGTASESLEGATNELFSIVYNYRTDREEDSVKERKKKARTLTSERALTGLFPVDADTIVPSIETVSTMEGAPEIYLMPSNEKELTALIVVPYAVSIAGSEKQKGTFMYKVVFSPESNQFTRIENVGTCLFPRSFV